MVWVLQFDGVNDWVDMNPDLATLTGDFEIDIDFIYTDGAANQCLFCRRGSNNDHLRINSTTQVNIRPGSTNNTRTLNTALVVGTRYQWRLKRTGTTYDLTDWSNVSLISSTVTSSANWQIGMIGKQNVSSFFAGQLASWRLTYPTDTSIERFYDADASGGTGSVLPETETTVSDAALTGFSATPWVDLGGASDDLLADDLQSTSELTRPAIGQTHALTADDLQSASELTRPAVGSVAGIDNLLADDLQSLAQLSSPSLSDGTFQLAAAIRTLVVQSEIRTATIEAETRTRAIAAESRTMTL